MSFVRESVMINGRPLTFETGRLAKQAHGSILITYGDSVVLVTAVSGDERPGLDFFPLTCEYQEKTFAAGKIPGGFFKREGRLRDDEILTCRLIDRPCRPLFPEGYKKDTQIIATVMSTDKVNPTDVLGLTGASAALHISDIPWDGPLVGVRVSRVKGELVAYPTFEQQAESDIDMIVACTKEAIVMVEGGCAEASENDVIDALMFAHKSAQPVLELIEKLRAAVGKPKRPFEPKKLPADIAAKIPALVDTKILESSLIKDKKKRYEGYKAAKDAMVASLTEALGPETFLEHEKLIKAEFDERKYEVVRDYVLREQKRIDGRDGKTIRPISIEASVLPRVHGSALFQRGETQAIVTATLGTSSDEQKIDGLVSERWKRFMLHYNFPPFSTGETKPLRGPGRREIGHGALAERALVRMLPDKEGFPYTVRIVSETLESNGSSSMAAVCGGSLALMDAGVPIKAPVAGIAMGLISDGPVDKPSTRMIILSDILGDEDHLGDMDFKVCGTSKGITSIQMDIKIAGLNRQVLQQALDQAREGRMHILGKMNEVLAQPRAELSQWAPRITSIKVKPDQIRLIIGPGGKTIKGIVDQTGVAIDVEDDGTVNIASADSDAVKKALDIIKGLTAEPDVGAVYKGTVQRITDFGAFVEILPGTDGLLHVSEMAHVRVERVTDVMKEGDTIEVKVLEVGRDGKIRLTRRELLPLPEGEEGERAKARMMASRESGGGPPSRGRDGDRGGRGGERGGRGGPRGRN
jgi:polyribonucleotide nucleotidyltransferase